MTKAKNSSNIENPKEIKKEKIILESITIEKS